MAVIVLTLGLVSCDEDDYRNPKYSVITITPEKDVYKVGDVVTCSIKEIEGPGQELKKASYWWYASWWFADSEQKADFQEFDETGTNRSSQIVLTKAGDVNLYFFGRIEYPNFDFRKVEEYRTIKVEE